MVQTPYLSVFADTPAATGRKAEMAYRGLTLAAIVVLLATLWVF
jgi:hypothetical protein